MVSFMAAFVAFREEVMVLTDSICKTPSLSVLETEINQKVADRDKCNSNVIIYGSDESNVKINAEQINLDTALVQDISLQLKLMIQSLEWLGKFDTTICTRGGLIKVFLHYLYLHC